MGEKFKITANLKFQVLLYTSYLAVPFVLITAKKKPQVCYKWVVNHALNATFGILTRAHWGVYFVFCVIFHIN